MNKSRTLLDIIDHIEPLDRQERSAVAQVRSWIGDGRDLFRGQEPATPPQHLAVFFVLVDSVRRSLLLVDHKKAGLWLPTGGHVEPGEDPRSAATREMAEELGTRAALVASIATLPLFLTITKTTGHDSHTDISLWYVTAGDERMWIDPDPAEFNGHRWQSFDSVVETEVDKVHPDMHRFMEKLTSRM
jgi:8-oxo-dGTP diphosphatase